MEPRTDSWRPSPDLSYEDALTKIIPEKFRRFLFIVGEQIAEMTDLGGKSLQETIYSIVNLQDLDNIYDKVIKIKEYSGKVLEKAIEKDDSIEKKRKKQEQEIIDKERLISDSKTQLVQLNKNLDYNLSLKNDFELANKRSIENKGLIKKYYEIKSDVEKAEAEIETLKLSYIKSYLDRNDFTISKLINNKFNSSTKLDTIVSNFKSHVAKRNTELNDNLDDEERNMMLSLEKSQPKPEILEQMVAKNHCFVCNSKLNKSSREYIEKKLIPFFNNEDNEDFILNKIQDVYSLFQNLNTFNSKFKDRDLYVFEDREREIASLITKRKESNDKLELFIQEKGRPLEDNNDDDVNIETYNRAVNEINKINRTIKDYEEDIKSYEEEISIINKELRNNTKKDSPEVNNARNFKNFYTDIEVKIREIQSQKYHEFAEKLSKLATERYRRLFAHQVADNNRVVVNVKENGKNEYSFKVKVLDKFDHNTEDAGGAHQAIRRISIVLALLDMADTRVSYPFILDAPVSVFSPDNKLQFFKTIIEDSKDDDKSIEQVIFTSMDIVSSENSKKKDALSLNSLGKELEDIVSENNENQILKIWNNNVQK